MLRRRLLIFLGSLVGLLLIVGVLAIWLLQVVLSDLNHTGNEDGTIVETAYRMGERITQVEIELHKVQLQMNPHLDELLKAIKALRREVKEFGGEYGQAIPAAKERYERIGVNLNAFEKHVGMLATSPDDRLKSGHTNEALTASIGMREDIMAVGRMMREHVGEEEAATVAWFRWLVLTLAVVFLLVINISVMVLLRMANMVLKPVDKLVEASRRLAKEEFDVRVEVGEGEFGELARAYNQLAAQLQENEQRKLETLGQAAVMLNHELNNMAAIIKLQLQLLGKQSQGSPTFEKCLRQINESLGRMTATVEALKKVRRIVLTDYVAGTKMLDLRRSVEEEEGTAIGHK